MIRKSFLIQARPGMAAEYERRHNPIWPELQKVMKDHVVHNFSIFLHEETNYLFGYLEIENEDRYHQMSKNDVCKRWWKHMSEVLVCDLPDSEKGREDILAEVFHMD